MFQCIGQHKDKGGSLTRCGNTSETPIWKDIYLCSSCANERPNKHSPLVENSNVGAMQTDAAEYKDQMESGFMHGIRGSILDESDS